MTRFPSFLVKNPKLNSYQLLSSELDVLYRL